MEEQMTNVKRAEATTSEEFALPYILTRIIHCQKAIRDANSRVVHIRGQLVGSEPSSDALDEQKKPEVYGILNKMKHEVDELAYLVETVYGHINILETILSAKM